MDNSLVARAKQSITWLVDHWYLPIAVIASAVVFAFSRRGPTPAQRAQVELDAIAAKREVAQIAADKGAEAAHEHVAQNFAAHAAALTEERKHEAELLADDPAALAAYLVRAAGTAAVAAPPSSPNTPKA